MIIVNRHNIGEIMTQITGIAEAVVLAGSQENLANQLGVSQQAVSKWERRGYVPAHRVLEIEAQYGIARDRLIEPRLADLLVESAI